MELDLDLLEEIVVNMFTKMKIQGITSLDADYYWDVPSKDIYNVYDEPEQLDIGQLSEDYEFLCNAYKGGYLVQHNFNKIASLLRYLSERPLHDIDQR
ncbi:hypothetical protein MKU92_004784 [Salmonella enterica]|uniref:hypothetical protein n=1 Tax=Salmonella enterica TaxID=28901 RepID=UPI00101112B7|nr:hypothetical protein [Salmonella enterica]EDS4738605.1 hypothetical protein [Salmonella enterica subsp. enterica serovar Oranienburg]EHM3444063.1 hypothetical protein [Salmonella enterica subsp. enterica]EDF8720540.1 hypothetical protein [Salmonella enterica]EEH2569860.1 hypothetical protein [Salmonella enterica]EHW9183340.1 hypothetical protein [Salmonella enterica subsp. enterica]